MTASAEKADKQTQLVAIKQKVKKQILDQAGAIADTAMQIQVIFN